MKYTLANCVMICMTRWPLTLRTNWVTTSVHGMTLCKAVVPLYVPKEILDSPWYVLNFCLL